MGDNIFLKIIRHEVPANIRFEDDEIIVFDDVNPKAKIHLLVVPKKPLASLAESSEDDQALLGKLLYRVKLMADESGLKDGYRTVINTGSDGGQEVPQLHIHLLGGEKLDV